MFCVCVFNILLVLLLFNIIIIFFSVFIDSFTFIATIFALNRFNSIQFNCNSYRLTSILYLNKETLSNLIPCFQEEQRSLMCVPALSGASAAISDGLYDTSKEWYALYFKVPVMTQYAIGLIAVD